MLGINRLIAREQGQDTSDLLAFVHWIEDAENLVGRRPSQDIQSLGKVGLHEGPAAIPKNGFYREMEWKCAQNIE